MSEKPRTIKRKWWYPLWRLLRAILFAYLVVTILLAFLQRKLLYFPATSQSLAVNGFPEVTRLFPAASDVELTCADGVRIRGWLLQKEKSNDNGAIRRSLVIYFHGNAGDRSGRIGWYELLESLDVDVLAIDYHGYGDSDGSITEEALELDCDAAWEFATQRAGYAPQDITIVGTSLGGAAAIYLTEKQCRIGTPPAGLVTVATFSSMVDAGRSHYPWLPVGLILVDRYPSDERIPHVTCPLVLLHGDQDRIVRQEFGDKLFQAAPDASVCGIPKRWVNVPGVGHNNLIFEAADTIQSEIQVLLDSIRRRE